MKPGDLVRVNTHPFAPLTGKVGMVVEEVTPIPARRRTYNVMVDGLVYYFYEEALEPVDATR